MDDGGGLEDERYTREGFDEWCQTFLNDTGRAIATHHTEYCYWRWAKSEPHELITFMQDLNKGVIRLVAG